MARRNGDNTGHRCRVTLVEIAAFGADAKRAAEKLGVTVSGDWANRPSVAIEDAAAVPQLGLELVEEQFARHIEWQEQQHRLVAAAREAAFHVTHDPDPQVQAVAGRGWRPSVSGPGRARSTDRGGRPASDGL
jgi:hypothetical protein